MTHNHLPFHLPLNWADTRIGKSNANKIDVMCFMVLFIRVFNKQAHRVWCACYY